MPSTLKHAISYPAGSQAPNIPVVLQQTAESVEAALKKVAEPPSGIFRKTSQGSHATANTWTEMLWEIEDHKTADLTHSTTTNKDAVTVPSAGIYEVKAKLGVNVAGLTSGVIISVNGADLTYTISSASSAAGAFDKVATAHDLKLSAGDVVRIRGRVNSTSPVWDGAVCSFSVVRKVHLNA